MKKDAVPGMTTDVRVTPDAQGPLHARRARSCAGSATRRCARRWWSRTRRRSTAGRSARRAARSRRRAGSRRQQGARPPAPTLSSRPARGARPLRWPPWRVAQPNAGTLRRLMAPGWIRAAWMTLAGAAFAFGARRRRPGAPGIRPVFEGDADRDGDPARRAARLPGRDRRLRLLGPVDDRRADASPRTTPTTARAAGRTTSGSTPTTR